MTRSNEVPTRAVSPAQYEDFDRKAMDTKDGRKLLAAKRSPLTGRRRLTDRP
jgi:hypothetical protein